MTDSTTAATPPYSGIHTLRYPVEFNDVIYYAIPLKRMTAGELRTFMEASARGEDPHFPVIDCPPGLLDNLEADDFADLDKAAYSFLPRAFLTVTERISDAIDNTSLSPPTS